MSSSTLVAEIRHLRGKLAVEERRKESDEQLLHAFTTQCDDSAFAVLVRRHGPMVLRVCRRVLGHEEDAFQAVFLVLARNAESLRNKASLASFLHGTAYRTAMKAKQTAARRRKHENQKPAKPAVDPMDELSWREVRTLLDEEIANLPEIYRSVFVLCCLEDLSRVEAAQRLGLKQRTVLSRLAEARKRLSKTLKRRGIELTAVLAASALMTPAASALPARLIAKTMKAVLAAASGKELAKVVSATVVELVESATTLVGGKAKIATVLLLTASMMAGASVYILASPHYQQETPSLALWAGKETTEAAASAKRELAKTIVIQGQVFDPEGKPKGGAKVLLLRQDDKPQLLGTSAADGRFTVAVPKKSQEGYLVAQADGLGVDFVNVPTSNPRNPVEFRLVKDRPIHGRVVNTEGKPVPGVRVAVDNLGVYANNSLDSFLAVWKKQQNVMSGLPNGEKHIWRGAGKLIAATTDAQGGFTIPQVGDERLVSLRLSGGGIADMEVWVANRHGFDPKPYNQAVLDNSELPAIKIFGNHWRLYDPAPAIVAEAGKIIRGIVKDADSGQGRSGVRVRITRQDDSRLVRTICEAITDAQGRYEIRGAHKATRYMLEIAGDAATGYMPCQVWADDTFGYDPVIADIRAKKGVIITGKVIDQATGKSVPGWAMADVLSENSFVKAYPSFDHSAFATSGERTSEDGTFRVVTIPGPVLLMGGRNPDTEYRPGGNLETLQYKPASADDRFPQYFHKYPDRTAYHSYRGAIPFLPGNFCKVLEIKPGATIVNQDIVLERASALSLKLQDEQGQPMSKVWVAGITHENWHRPVWIEGDTCSAYGVAAGKPRIMVFYHPAKKLLGTRTLRGDEKQPIAVKLVKGGAIKGQLLDTDVKPLVGIVVDVRYRDREAEEMDRIAHEGKQVVTDAQGAFALDALIPQARFQLAFRHGRRRLEGDANLAKEAIEVKSDESRDLGAIQLRSVNR